MNLKVLLIMCALYLILRFPVGVYMTSPHLHIEEEELNFISITKV